jgi:hypothetical protein
MALTFDRVGMSTSTVGAGTLTLGAALGNVSPNLAAFLSFAGAGVANGQTVSYLILDSNNGWEVGIGIYTSSGTTLTRTVFYSSNSNNAISLSGNAQVFITEIAEDVNQAGYGGFRNKFRNPGVDVDQRGTNGSAAAVTTAGAYVTDGHIVVPTGASVTAQQITRDSISSRSANSLKITGATSVTGLQVKLRIESTTAAPLASQQVTVQCKVYNSTGGSITPKLSAGAPAGVDSFAAFNGAPASGDLNAVNLQACANGATTTLAYTWAGGAGLNTGLEATFDFGNNFTTNTKFIELSDFDIRVTPAVATGLNSNPPPTELRPISFEKLDALRFYQPVPGYGVPMWVQSAATLFISYQYLAPMRAAPTATLVKTSVAAASFEANAGSTWISGSGLTFTAPGYGASGFAVQWTGFSGLTAGNTAGVNFAGTFFTLTAEL